MHKRAAGLVVVSTLVIGAVAVAQTWDAPIRRAGYWEQSMAMNIPGHRIVTMHYCTDMATEKKFSAFGQTANPGMCSKREMHRTPAGMTFESVCTIGGRTMTTTGVATGDFQTHFHIHTSIHAAPAAPGMAGQTVDIEGKWLGACPPGRKPGDMVMDGGVVMNMGAMAPH